MSSQETDVNLGSVLAILKEVRTSASETQKSISEMAVEIGGINVKIGNIEESNKTRDKELKEFREAQLTCPARTSIIGVNGRLKKHDKDIETLKSVKIHGNSNFYTSQKLAFFIKMIPYLAFAIAVGGGLFAFFLMS